MLMSDVTQELNCDPERLSRRAWPNLQRVYKRSSPRYSVCLPMSVCALYVSLMSTRETSIDTRHACVHWQIPHPLGRFLVPGLFVAYITTWTIDLITPAEVDAPVAVLVEEEEKVEIKPANGDNSKVDITTTDTIAITVCTFSLRLYFAGGLSVHWNVA